MKWLELKWNFKYLWAASYPNPGAYKLEVKNFLDMWRYSGMGVVLVVTILITWYYWWTKPDLTANKRFWVTFGFSWLVTVFQAFLPLKYLTTKASFGDKLVLYLTSLNSAILNMRLIYLILAIVILAISQAPTTGNLRAMRKYPFSWVP